MERATLTPEDQAIFQKQLARLIRACDRAGHPPAQTVAIVRRWTFDYLGLPP